MIQTLAAVHTDLLLFKADITWTEQVQKKNSRMKRIRFTIYNFFVFIYIAAQATQHKKLFLIWKKCSPQSHI